MWKLAVFSLYCHQSKPLNIQTHSSFRSNIWLKTFLTCLNTTPGVRDCCYIYCHIDDKSVFLIVMSSVVCNACFGLLELHTLTTRGSSGPAAPVPLWTRRCNFVCEDLLWEYVIQTRAADALKTKQTDVSSSVVSLAAKSKLRLNEVDFQPLYIEPDVSQTLPRELYDQRKSE